MPSFTIENVFGVGSFRLCAGFPSALKSTAPSDDHIYECPLNGCITVHNHSTDQRLHFEHVYDDIIVLMLYHEHVNQVLTCSYSGKVIIWSSDYQKRLVEQQTRINHIHYGCWTKDGTTIYLCSRFDGRRSAPERVSSRNNLARFLGSLLALSYDSQRHCLTESWLRHWATPRIGVENVPAAVIDQPVAAGNVAEKIETSNTYVAGTIGYEFVVCTALHRHLFAVLQRPYEHVHIHQLNLHDGHLADDLKLQQAKPNQTFLCATTTTIGDKETGKEFFAVGLQSGMIFIIDTDPLQVRTVINGRRHDDATHRLVFLLAQHPEVHKRSSGGTRICSPSATFRPSSTSTRSTAP